MAGVKTTDARTALRGLIHDAASSVAARNNRISVRAEAGLPAFVQDVADRIVRPRDGEVEVDALVTSSMNAANAKWRRFNTRGPTTLSPTEVDAIANDDPALGTLTRKAYQLATPTGTNSGDERITQARIAEVKQWVSDHFDDVSNGTNGTPLKDVDLMGAALTKFHTFERRGAGSFEPNATSYAMGSKPAVAVTYADDSGRTWFGIYTPKGKRIASGSTDTDGNISWT